MRIFNQSRDAIYEVRNVEIVEPKRFPDESPDVTLVNNTYWIREDGEDVLYSDTLGKYETRGQAQMAVYGCFEALERGDAIYRMPSK